MKKFKKNMCLLNTMCGFFDFVAPKKDKCPKCKVKLVECGEIRYKKKMRKVLRCPLCDYRKMKE
jgi:uncharacterized protein with PIN domain